MKLKTYCSQVTFLPPKRKAFHKRGGCCTEPSAYLNRLVSSETMDGPSYRLASRSIGASFSRPPPSRSRARTTSLNRGRPRGGGTPEPGQATIIFSHSRETRSKPPP